MLNRLSLATVISAATFGVGAFAQSAQAALFNFSYTLLDGSVLAGMLEGDIQPDGDTVVVSAITMPTFSGSPAPEINFIESALEVFTGGAFPGEPLVSFSGSVMDIFTCTDDGSLCDDGFAFLPAGLFGPAPLYASGTSYGGAFELYNPDNWSLSLKQPVPEPTGFVALVMVGGSLLLSRRSRRN